MIYHCHLRWAFLVGYFCTKFVQKAFHTKFWLVIQKCITGSALTSSVKDYRFKSYFWKNINMRFFSTCFLNGPWPIHFWSFPSLGIKIDGCFARLNQLSFSSLSGKAGKRPISQVDNDDDDQNPDKPFKGDLLKPHATSPKKQRKWEDELEEEASNTAWPNTRTGWK